MFFRHKTEGCHVPVISQRQMWGNYFKENVNIMENYEEEEGEQGIIKNLKSSSEKETGGVSWEKHAAKCKWREKKTLTETYGVRENRMQKDRWSRSEKVYMNTIGCELTKIDSSYLCPDKPESPITAAIPPSIIAGWEVLHWHEKSTASASASPY